jgi:hypothetical protein
VGAWPAEGSPLGAKVNDGNGAPGVSRALQYAFIGPTPPSLLMRSPNGVLLGVAEPLGRVNHWRHNQVTSHESAVAVVVGVAVLEPAAPVGGVTGATGVGRR